MEIAAYVAYDTQRNGLLLYFHQNKGFWFLYEDKVKQKFNLKSAKTFIQSKSACDCDFIKIFRSDSQRCVNNSNYKVTYYLFKPKLQVSYYKDGFCNMPDFSMKAFISMTEACWLTKEQIDMLASQKMLMGLEPVDFLNSNSLVSDEITTHLVESKFQYINMNANGNDEEQLIASAGFYSHVQAEHFAEFLRSTFPSSYLSLCTFDKMFCKYQRFNISSLFNAFDMNQNKCLCYKDYILGMAALNNSTNHGGSTGEIRCKYIFRYYNSSCTGVMTFQEFKVLVADLHKARNHCVTEQELEKFAADSFATFVTNGSGISINRFLSVIGQLKFRGTSLLFRMSDVYNNNNSNHHSGNRVTGEEKELTAISYQLAPYVVVLKPNVNNRIVPLNDAVYNSCISNDSRSAVSTDHPHLWFIYSPMGDSIPCKTLSALRIHEKYTSLSNSETYWKHLNNFDMGKSLLYLCRNVQLLLRNQPRLLKIHSPCYIIGDIHGNIEDMLNIEKFLWRNDINIFPANVLFLGDYVDRGAYGVEVVAYLFAQKLMAPEKWFMVRGNHELRSTQSTFNFHNECRQKFGTKLGEKVWEEINVVFDCMPFVAVIDETILCVHGGIPNKKLYSGPFCDAVCAIPIPLKEPDSSCLFAWELMWNDPSDDFENDPNAFSHNTQRGTGSFFSKKALIEFLSQQHFSHLIRAHELKEHGFEIRCEGKLITIFSSSDYCSSQNDAAIALCESQRILILNNMSKK